MINPNLSGTWLDPPHKKAPTDSTTYWEHGTSFPKKTQIAPKVFKDSHMKAPPRISYYTIVDESLRGLLEAPGFKSVHLDQDAFNHASLDVSSSPHTNLDSLIRLSMLDSFTMEEFLSMAIDLTCKASSQDFTEEDRIAHQDLLLRVLVYASECSHRSTQAQLAAFVANKLALRDTVLTKFSAQSSSREILRGTSFLSPELFGPLPESFKASLMSAHSKEHRFSIKTGSGKGVSTPSTSVSASSLASSLKRASEFHNPGPAKRAKGSGRGRGGPARKLQFFCNQKPKRR